MQLAFAFDSMATRDESLINGIYHEKQRLALCAVHALNNLFQRHVFSSSALDDIAYGLTPQATFSFNPHKSVWGIGNYDVNVVEKALDTVGCSLKWLKQTQDVQALDLDKYVGLLLNITTIPQNVWQSMKGKISGVDSHWVAVTRISGVWYDLDSKLPRPRELGGTAAFREWLRQQQQAPKVHVLLVYRNTEALPSAEGQPDST